MLKIVSVDNSTFAIPLDIKKDGEVAGIAERCHRIAGV